MYSAKENVNILTALLVKHEIRHAVVCPGSRNAPIIHNLNEHPAISCYPVTDERSAGFYALGLAQATGAPVAVCVTSGTALLGLAPAVAEAHYQHQSLIVISADRPAAWIGQLDGQTLRQPHVLGEWVAKCVSLPEPTNEVERWHCNRLVNEALLEARADHRPCIHINIPITEPLFQFTAECLPDERLIHRFQPSADYDCLPVSLVDRLLSAERPMIVFGQAPPYHFMGDGLEYLFSHVIVLHEQLAPFQNISHFDEVLYAVSQQEELIPDFIIYVGDVIVSKRLKNLLRRATTAQVWRISTTGHIEDTFMNLHGIIKGDAEFVLQSISHKLQKRKLRGMAYRRRWLHLLTEAGKCSQQFEPAFSQMAAVKYFEEHFERGVVHYANSTAVRLANIYAQHHVWCNRGVNGIEGSLSTAAGFSVISSEKVFCVIGDLSFFYDQNALWNQNLRAPKGKNLRILLLNNGGGGIFSHLQGLEQSPACNSLVAAAHHTTAEGICRQNGVAYLSATTMETMQQGISHLLTDEISCPMLLEVFTDAETDAKVFRDYYATMKHLT